MQVRISKKEGSAAVVYRLSTRLNFFGDSLYGTPIAISQSYHNPDEANYHINIIRLAYTELA